MDAEIRMTNSSGEVIEVQYPITTNDFWLEPVTEDIKAEAEPNAAGVRIECREGCGW